MTNENKTRPMVCECGSNRISTEMDVGFDIDPSGEESQHLDTCLECGKTRLWVHRWPFDSVGEGPDVHWGKWKKSDFWKREFRC